MNLLVFTKFSVVYLKFVYSIYFINTYNLKFIKIDALIMIIKKQDLKCNEKIKQNKYIIR